MYGKLHIFVFPEKRQQADITRQQLTPYFYRPLNLNCICPLFIILERFLLIYRFRNIDSS